MGKIKSALEIALERTEAVKSDKGSVALFEAKQKGKKLANDFLEGTITSLEDALKQEAGDTQASLKQGIFDVLVSRIALPASKDDMGAIEAAGRGLAAIIGGKEFTGMIRQFNSLASGYLDESARYDQAIRQQYAPKLRQKEEELARRYGRQVKLDPFQDPEFVAFYTQHLNALKANYQEVVDQAREEAARLFGGNAAG